ncbi:hypothetical protein UFOVP1636_242 [uncultured Caudovirales phage]|uniref:Uncharacterized protein n=1 Tax=uncultured Caudovirales phage TaxID=2100421 RepID=A0A6J5T2W6_9CAUD|nr:hypothetical protein UFOVP1636_242 [uncultured Caudovirales phage]
MIAKIDSIESASAVGEGKGDDIADKVAKKKEERDDPFSSSYKDKNEKSASVTRVKGKSYGNQDSEDGHKSDDDSDQDEDDKKKKKKKSKLEEADECTCTDDKEDAECPVHGDHKDEKEVEESAVNPLMIPAINRKSNARGGNFPLSLDQVRSGEIGQIQKLAGIGNNNFKGLKPVHSLPKGPAGPRGLNESFDQAMAEEQVDEVTAPGQEGWVKANKERFIKQYGEEKGLKTLYSTAWKRHHAANESKNLEECYDQAMMAQPEETGMNINSSMDTKTGSKSLTVSAQGQAAEELAQILKLSGLLDGGASHEMEPEVVDIELDEYANEPNPITQSAEVQFNSGNDMHRKKHSQTVGAPVAIGNLAEQQKLAEIERRLMAQLNELKVVSEKAKPDTKKKGAAPKKGVNPFAKKDDVEEAINTGASLKRFKDDPRGNQKLPATPKKELDEFDIDTLNQLASHPMAGTLAAAGGAAIGATIGKGITKAADWYKNRQEKKAQDHDMRGNKVAEGKKSK